MKKKILQVYEQPRIFVLEVFTYVPWNPNVTATYLDCFIMNAVLQSSADVDFNVLNSENIM